MEKRVKVGDVNINFTALMEDSTINIDGVSYNVKDLAPTNREAGTPILLTEVKAKDGLLPNILMSTVKEDVALLLIAAQTVLFRGKTYKTTKG